MKSVVVPEAYEAMHRVLMRLLKDWDMEYLSLVPETGIEAGKEPARIIEVRAALALHHAGQEPPPMTTRPPQALTSEEIERLKALHEKAPPTPWDIYSGWPLDGVNWLDAQSVNQHRNLKQFVCALRNAAPALLHTAEFHERLVAFVRQVAGGGTRADLHVANDLLAALDAAQSDAEKCPRCGCTYDRCDCCCQDPDCPGPQ